MEKGTHLEIKLIKNLRFLVSFLEPKEERFCFRWVCSVRANWWKWEWVGREIIL